jgi:hypothetical protein
MRTTDGIAKRAKPTKLAEVVGSNPTPQSISYCDGITALNHSCFRKISDKIPFYPLRF